MIALISITLSSTFIHRVNELYANGQSVEDIIDVLNAEYATTLEVMGSLKFTAHDVERAIRMEQDTGAPWYDMLDMLHDWLAARAEADDGIDPVALSQVTALEFIEWAQKASLKHFLIDDRGDDASAGYILTAMESMQSVLSHETRLNHKWVGGGRETAVRELIGRLPVVLHPQFLTTCVQNNEVFKGDLGVIVKDLNGRWQTQIQELNCGPIVEADVMRAIEIMRKNYSYEPVTMIFHWLKSWLPLHAPNRRWAKDLTAKINSSKQEAVRMDHLDQTARKQLEDQFNLFVTWLMFHNNVRYVTPSPAETLNISNLRDMFFGVKAAIIYASKRKLT